MATLAFSVVGAGVGSYTGIGAGAGWTAGSTMGKMLFPDQDSSSTSLSDLNFSGASYGAVIPSLFGTMKLGGNIIWAGDLQEENGESQISGKGGASNTAVQAAQSYFLNFAIAFSSGVVDELLKIWADGILIYDAQSAGEKKAADIRFRFYNGDESQTADSVMEAELGVGNVPAYRGISYLVFDALPLANYGNRVPNIEVLITKKAFSNYPKLSGGSYPFIPSQIARDTTRNALYSYEVVGGGDVFRKIDLSTLTVIQEAEIGVDFPELADAQVGLCLDRNGDFWVGTGFGNLPGRQIHRFNSNLMTVAASNELPDGIGAVTYSVDISETITGAKFQVAGSQQSGQVVVFDEQLEMVDYAGTNSPACSGVVRDAFENAWVIMTGIAAINPFADLEIIKVSLWSSPSEAGIQFNGNSTVHTIAVADLVAADSGASNCVTKPVVYLSATQEIVLLNNYRLMKFSMISGDISTYRDGDVNNYEIIANSSDGDSFVVLESDRWLVYISCDDLQEIERVDLQLFGDIGDFATGLYDAKTDSIVILPNNAPIQRLYLRRYTGDNVAFSELVLSLTAAAGLDNTDVDVSELNGDIGGYLINRSMTIQDALDPLLLAGNFNLAESGYSLKFCPLDQSPVLEIPVTDLMQKPIQSRIQESELPGVITLSYMAYEAGYQIGTQTAKRSYAPHVTMYGRNEVNIKLPMALSSQSAKTVCYQALYGAWAERNVQSLRMPTKYLALDPADVIRLTGAGASYEGRLNQTYLAPDFSLDVETVGASMLTSSLSLDADKGSGYSDDVITATAFSKSHILDIPLLRDEDATAGALSRYYFGISSFGDDWNSAALFTSNEGSRYDQVAYTSNAIGWGVAANALSDVSSPWQTDAENILTVRFAQGGERQESISQLEMLNGKNALLVGSEIIQFSNLNIRADGLAELSGLLRGRRGTESACSGHVVGDLVIMLEQDRVSSAVAALSFLNTAHYWKAVSAGQLLEEVSAERKSLSGTDLMPYAPVHVKAERETGLLLLSWVRRTRVGGGSLAGIIPLSESSERYELVFEYAGLTVRKYVDGMSNFTYELIEFNEDFKLTEIEIPSLSLSIYQLSEAIGRGFTTKEIV